MKSKMMVATLVALAGTAHAQPTVSHGSVDVEFGPFTVTLRVGNGSFELDSPDVGLYDFLVPGTSDPAFPTSGGVLLTSASEIRDFSVDGSWNASAAANNGGWRVTTFDIGPFVDPVTMDVQGNGDDFPDQNVAEDLDSSFAFFPFGQNWNAAFANPASTVVNGPLAVGAGDVQLVTEANFAAYDASFPALVDLPDNAVPPFIPFDGSAAGKVIGRYALVLPQFNNVHREGILLASSPSGESQIVFPVQAQNDNDSYIAPYFDNLPQEKTMQVWVYDVNTSLAGEEADGVAFAYVPFGSTYTPSGGSAQPLPMGLINGTALFERAQGPVSFERTRSDGDAASLAWTEGELKVTGLDPTNSTLIAFASGGSNQSQDNIFTYEPNATNDGWLLQLRDGPTYSEDGLSPEFHAVHFVVLPDNADITAATPEQVPSNLTDFESTTLAASFTVESFSTSNGRGATFADEAAGFPADIQVTQIAGSSLFSLAGENRGDNALAIDGLLASPVLGVTIPQTSEIGRFTVTGGLSVDPAAGDTDTRVFSTEPQFAVSNFENRVVTENINNGGEINSNFVVAHFPIASGFPQQPEVSFIAGTINDAEVVPTATAADIGFATNEGVLFARTSGNFEGNAVVDVDASQFEIRIVDSDSLIDPASDAQDPVTGVDTDNSRLGWVALPYSTPGLIAAQVNADGSVANGTGGFSVTAQTIDVDTIQGDLTRSGTISQYTGYNIAIPGVDSNTDGVLLLQGIGDPTESADAGVQVFYEAASDGSFDVVAINVFDRDTANDPDILDIDADFQAPFMFAFIPFTGLPGEPIAPGCSPADLVEPFGVISQADVAEFVNLFFASDPRVAVLAAPTDVVSQADVGAFVDLFFAGCPTR
ncbi:MAG: hypothetical protein AAFR38_08635 [Planctomycetota bacterium]